MSKSVKLITNAAITGIKKKTKIAVKAGAKNKYAADDLLDMFIAHFIKADTYNSKKYKNN